MSGAESSHVCICVLCILSLPLLVLKGTSISLFCSLETPFFQVPIAGRLGEERG